jgi:hypothetical protein
MSVVVWMLAALALTKHGLAAFLALHFLFDSRPSHRCSMSLLLGFWSKWIMDSSRSDFGGVLFGGVSRPLYSLTGNVPNDIGHSIAYRCFFQLAPAAREHSIGFHHVYGCPPIDFYVIFVFADGVKRNFAVLVLTAD